MYMSLKMAIFLRKVRSHHGSWNQHTNYKLNPQKIDSIPVSAFLIRKELIRAQNTTRRLFISHHLSSNGRVLCRMKRWCPFKHYGSSLPSHILMFYVYYHHTPHKRSNDLFLHLFNNKRRTAHRHFYTLRRLIIADLLLRASGIIDHGYHSLRWCRRARAGRSSGRRAWNCRSRPATIRPNGPATDRARTDWPHEGWDRAH